MVQCNIHVHYTPGKCAAQLTSTPTAPFFEPDVDDSAKTITSLTQLGQPLSPQKLVEVFEAPTHFRTYSGERDPSLSANCNALIALLHSDPASYSSQILKITRFLSDYWWKSDGKIKDKWVSGLNNSYKCQVGKVCVQMEKEHDAHYICNPHLEHEPSLSITPASRGSGGRPRGSRTRQTPRCV